MDAESGSRGDRLRLARVARRLTQHELAAAAGITRQAISGLEAGRFDPSLDVALAVCGVLGTSVEELFGVEADPPTVTASSPQRPAAGERVEVAHVGGRLVAFPLAHGSTTIPGFVPALGVVEEASHPRGADAGARVRLLAASELPRTLVVAGCDPAIPLLGPALSHQPHPASLVWWPCGNRQAARLLREGAVHVAALHRRAGRASPADTSVTAVGFAAWREGLALGADLPARLATVRELAEHGARLANREHGSEARRLLDAAISEAGITGADLPGYGTTVLGHLPVAAAIAAGLADFGVTTEPAALAYGLRFVPWQDEVTELHVRRELVEAPELRALLGALGGGELRRQLESIRGYDASVCGSAVA
jgi:putative molybdopterin biosynthesis protein